MKTNVWDRRENESIQAYEAFCVYRDLGSERSILKAAQKLLKSEGTLKRIFYVIPHGSVHSQFHALYGTNIREA